MRQAINRLLGVICFPFGGMEYYEEDYLLTYLFKQKMNKTKRENHLLSHFAAKIKKYCEIHSLDEMYLLFDKYYVRKINNGKCKHEEALYKLYFEILSCMARAFISQRDGKIVYKYWANEADERFLGGFATSDKLLLFQAMNTRIAVDTIVIEYLLDNGMKEIRHLNNFFGQVTVADLQLDQILSQGVAENHLHLGTAVNFFILWESILQHPQSIKKEYFIKFIHNLQSQSEIEQIHFYLLVEGIIRIMMSLFIKDMEDTEINVKFLTYWKKRLIENERENKQENKQEDEDEQEDESKENNELKELVYYILVSVIYGDSLTKIKSQMNINIEDIGECLGRFIEIWDFLINYIPRYSDEKSILINIFHNTVNIQTTEENIFLFKIMKYLKETNDLEASKLFFQYLRIKNEIFNLWVQDNGVRGLKYFNDFYHRNSDVVALCQKNFWERIINAQFQDKMLKKIEFRTTLSNKEVECKKKIIEFFNAYEKVVHQKYCTYNEEEERYELISEFPQAGIVYHLTKRKDETLPEKCWREYYLNEHFDVDLQTYKGLQQQYFKQVENLKKLRKEYPVLSRYLVGLDAASEENNTPVWVFAPVYEKARDSSEEPLYVEEYSGRDIYTQSLRFTFHAGEDFRHILSGLRRIDEVIEHCKFHAGDRIGHGVVLGINPEEWARKCPMVILPRIEILNNLLWIWWLFSQNPNKMQNVQFYIEQEIFKHAKAIYKNMQGINVPTLVEAYRKQFKVFDEAYSECYKYGEAQLEPNKGNEHVFCQWAKKEDTLFWTVDKLLACNHCKMYLVDMLEPVYYKVTPQEIIIAQEAQRILKHKISQEGIVVEVNPSSNAYITEAEGLFNNQAFELNDEENTEDNIMLCVNTDNPSSCQTNISNELAYIYYGLLARGKSKEISLKWIDKLRKNGVIASFIQNGISKELLLRELEQITKDLR